MGIKTESLTVTVHFSYGAVRGGVRLPIGKMRVSLMPRDGAQHSTPFSIQRVQDGKEVQSHSGGLVGYFEVLALLQAGQPRPLGTSEPQMIEGAHVVVESWHRDDQFKPSPQVVTAVAKDALRLLLWLRRPIKREIMVMHVTASSERGDGYMHQLLRSQSACVPGDVDILYIPPGCRIKLALGARPISKHINVTWEEFAADLYKGLAKS